MIKVFEQRYSLFAISIWIVVGSLVAGSFYYYSKAQGFVDFSSSTRSLLSVFRGKTFSGHKKTGKFDLYFEHMQKQIRKNWSPREGLDTKSLVVNFKLGLHGDVFDLKVVRSSGDVSADQAALKAIRTAAPFGPLPSNTSYPITVCFPFNYKYFQKG